MPDLPISGLPASGQLDGTELFATVQSGITKKTTLSSLVYLPGNNYGLFNQTSVGPTISNTTAESSIIGTGVGTLSVPANGFSVGDAFHATVVGHVSSVNNHTLRLRIKSNSVLLADTSAIVMPQTTNQHFKLDVYFSIYAIGGAGVASISTGGYFLFNKDAAFSFEGDTFSTENSTTFDTTVDNALSITAQWGQTNPGDSIYSNIVTLNKTY